jgi:hypothetical protein
LAITFNIAESNVEEALRFLNEIGDVMYFGGDADPSRQLHNLVFLDPQWLTDVLATVVTMRHNLVKDGKLYHDDLNLIWRAPLYPPKLHSVLLTLLKKFDIIYDLRTREEDAAKGTNGRTGKVSLIPCMLTEERPTKVAMRAMKGFKS